MRGKKIDAMLHIVHCMIEVIGIHRLLQLLIVHIECRSQILPCLHVVAIDHLDDDICSPDSSCSVLCCLFMLFLSEYVELFWLVGLVPQIHLSVQHDY